MRFLATLIVFLLCFTSTVFSATNNTQGGTPSYTKELVSLPSLDTPIQPIATAPVANLSNALAPNAATVGTPANGYGKMLQSLTGIDANKAVAKKHKLSLGQKLSLLKQVKKFNKESQSPTQGKSQVGDNKRA